MDFEVKGVAIDIDGTITHKDRSLNLTAVSAIRRLKVPVVLATGNISCYARTTAKLIGVSDIVICENGGIVRFEYDGEDIILGDIKKCVKAVEKLKEYFDITVLDSEYRKSEVCLRRTFELEKGREVLLNEGFDDVKLIDSGFAYHIIDAKVSKGSALRFIAKKLNIREKDFVAIGDSENDIDLLKTAGIGVAVANADKKLKDIADIITTKKDGEGVVEALEFLGLIA
jgi:hypothetical protein